MAKKKLTYVFGADLSELERAWKRIDRSMNKLSAQFKKVGSTITKTFTVPLVAMGAAATKAALDIDDAMDAIASGTGATGRALKSLQDDWKKLAGSVTQGFDVSAKVLADYNTRLGLTGKSLTDISQKALDAARLLGEDVSNVVSQSAKAMRDWAVPAEEMGKFMDVLFKASQSTGIGMGTLSTQLYKYGAALRGMGFDLESSIALLAQFEQQGVNTERIMGSLSMGLGRMAREGITDAGEAFRLLVEEIKNAENTTEATRLAIEVFGSRAGPDMALAIREGRFSVEQLIATLRDAEGAIQQTTKATDGFAEQWARTKNRVMLAIEPMGKEILNIAESVMPKVENSIASAATAIGNASDDTKKKILAFAGTLAVGGPLLLAISATINALSTLGGAFIALAAGPAAPLVIATAGVLALVAALHELKKAQEGIRPPEEVLSRTKLSEQAAEIFHARHGKYPLTAKDYEEIEKITDELISESVRHRARAVKEAPTVPTAAPEGAAGGATGGGGAKNTAAQILADINWAYQQGLTTLENFYAKASSMLSGLTKSSEDFQSVFATTQAAAMELATKRMEEYTASFISGGMSVDEYNSKVKELLGSFSQFPLAGKAIEELSGKGLIERSKAVNAEIMLSIELSKRMEQELLDAQEAATQGVDKFWSEVAWEYQQGFISSQEYFDMLKSEVSELTVGTDEWMRRFSELQAVTSTIAQERLEPLLEALQQGKMSTDEFKAAAEGLKAEFSEYPLVVRQIDDTMKQAQQTTSQEIDLVRDLGMTFQSAFEDAIIKGENLRSVLAGLLEDIARIILRVKVIEPLVGMILKGLPFSKGGVVENGKVTPFAIGGIVNRPTIFPMASGFGLMGEAGPEAILPLTRTSGGDLGVKASTGDVVVQVFDQRSGGEPVEVKQDMIGNQRVVKIMIREAVKELINEGSLDKAMGTFGVRRVARA